MLGKNISNFMPMIYAKFHDDILKNSISEMNQKSKNLSRDKVVYGKNKYGYIFQSLLQIKPVVHSMKDQMEYIGIIKKEKLIKNSGFLVADEEGVVKDISSSNLFSLQPRLHFLARHRFKVDFIVKHQL
jgi:hypothetical protein